MFFTIRYGYGTFNNGAFYGNSWNAEELSNCEWNSRKECEKTLSELSALDHCKYWIEE